ncbi:MAG TPA: galactose oxidase early set domain-containing protein [Candidatus Dormibacteraeota bacterium]
MRRSGLYFFATLLSAAGIAAVAVLGAGAASASTSTGSFSALFGEAGPNCPQDSPAFPMLPSPPSSIPCKPAAVSMAFLPGGNVLYWNGLEGMENVQVNTVAEFGQVATCDQARLLTLNYENLPQSAWNPAGDGNCSSSAYTADYIIPGLPIDGVGSARDALFCSDLVFLANGDVLTTGGTDYYDEPNIPGTNFGVSELEGTRTTRIFDPAKGWITLKNEMNYGRWYPGLVTLPTGDLFVASGVTKLLKPIYPNSPLDSGTNVEETETFHISGPQAGQWTYNGTQANFSLPLFPRLHLLPDGKVWYDAGGQTFNPDGQSYDEVLWNFPAIYDPASKTWTREMTIPGVGTLTPGFRGSGFSVQLPLKPPYTSASFLSGGGVDGVTPGTYLATNTSEINTIDTSKGDAWTNAASGNLNNARWYSTAVVLPDESVMAFSGATADEVVAPGTAMPIKQAERFDPATGTWTAMATATDGRTYHNTAMLLPTGQVLVGGHSPINFLYSREETLPGGFSNNFRDYTFEIYNPPYMSEQRPVITDESSQVLNYGNQFSVTTHQAAQITKVLLVRNPAITHLVDGDQRTVELNFTRDGDALHVQMPSNPAVLPPGPYYLFIDEGSGSNLIPSTANQVFVEKNTDNQASGGQTHKSTPAQSVPAATLKAAAQSTATARKVHVTLAAEERPELPLPLPLLPVAGVLLAGGSVLGVRRIRRSRRT